MERRISNPSSATPTTPKSPTARNLFGLLSPSKEKMSPSLKRALELLDLYSLENLESQFLANPAFLTPWANFRDSFLLVQTAGMPRATLPDQISGTDFLYFYTLYDEGRLRYDPLADEASSVYTDDHTQYGRIDKTTWGVVQFEKLLYLWLIQLWKVGKTRNPGNFAYFVCKNQVAAWREVFIPIVNAVRDSYDVKGRRHYGRLAKFIEEAAPSRLAFPENNVGVDVEPGVDAPSIPYRLVSKPKKQHEEKAHMSSTVMKTRHYDDTEKELRDVCPQYGQLVERPKKMNMIKGYLEDQRMKKEHEKARRMLEGESPTSSTFRKKTRKESFDSQPQSPLHGQTRVFETPAMAAYGEYHVSTASAGTMSPTNTTFGGLSPYGSVGHARKDPDGLYTEIRESSPFDTTPKRQRGDRLPSFASDSTKEYPLTPIDRLDLSTMSLDSISNYPPAVAPRPLFSDEKRLGVQSKSSRTGKAKATRIPSPATAYGEQQHVRPKDSTRTGRTPAMHAPSSLTANLNQEYGVETESSLSDRLLSEHIRKFSNKSIGRDHPALRESPYTVKTSPTPVRSPPHEFRDELHPALRESPFASKDPSPLLLRLPKAKDNQNSLSQKEKYRTGRVPATRIPNPIAVDKEQKLTMMEDTSHPLYTERKELTIPDTTTNKPFRLGVPPKTRKQLEQEKTTRANDDLKLSPPAPPVPGKNPKRHNPVIGRTPQVSHSTQQHTASLQSPDHLGFRIISKENIRAALGSSSSESLEEDISTFQHRNRQGSGSGSRANRVRPDVGPNDIPLRTYNTHMFPRQRLQGPSQVEEEEEEKKKEEKKKEDTRSAK